MSEKIEKKGARKKPRRGCEKPNLGFRYSRNEELMIALAKIESRIFMRSYCGGSIEVELGEVDAVPVDAVVHGEDA